MFSHIYKNNSEKVLPEILTPLPQLQWLDQAASIYKQCGVEECLLT